jgi:hypothetical protein
VVTTQLASVGYGLKTEMEWAGLMGLDLSENVESQVLLMPVGLRIEDDEGDTVDPSTISRSIFKDSNYALCWDYLEPKEVPQVHIESCLWQFAGLATSPDEEFGKLFMQFNQTWGIWSFGENSDFLQFEKADFLEIFYQMEEILQLHSLLVTLAATNSEELVGEDVLIHLRKGKDDISDDWWHPIASRWTPKLEGADLEAELNRIRERPLREHAEMLNHWRNLRQLGQGIQLQRRLVANVVSTEYFNSDNNNHVLWDAKGRRYAGSTLHFGVSQIVAASVMSLFLSPSIDIYVCSVCKEIYEHELGNNNRRPRKGAQRFCSDPCRQVAANQSKSKSYFNHKDDWPSTRDRKKGGNYD